MIIRSKAPLRIGLAGGGTDVSPYSDLYGGAILNATISLYAHTSIIPNDTEEVIIVSADRNLISTYPLEAILPTGGSHNHDLVIGVYNYMSRTYGTINSGFTITTSVDAPPGSGLGTSSTLIVSIVGAFCEWLKLPLGEYDIAHLAYIIEREDLKMAGGRQDQYTATFGGFNFMEFSADNKVIVNPIHVKDYYQSEMENNLLLYFTATSRLSSEIIDTQKKNICDKNEDTIAGMHQLKKQAFMMKEALMLGNLDEVGNILDFGFKNKKQTANNISNPFIDEIYNSALGAGATGGKISGAGGGGFMTFYCPANTRYNVMKALEKFGGNFHPYRFVKQGLTTWTID